MFQSPLPSSCWTFWLSQISINKYVFKETACQMPWLINLKASQRRMVLRQCDHLNMYSFSIWIHYIIISYLERQHSIYSSASAAWEYRRPNLNDTLINSVKYGTERFFREEEKRVLARCNKYNTVICVQRTIAITPPYSSRCGWFEGRTDGRK